ncbi:MAG: ATP-dependent DNA ligase, partial [Nocardioides sp.]
MLLLSAVVQTSHEVAATRSRRAKVTALANLLRQVDLEVADELEVTTAYLAGTLRQRRTGLGWRGLASLPAPAREATVTVVEVDRAFAELSDLAGPGSQAARAAGVSA